MSINVTPDTSAPVGAADPTTVALADGRSIPRVGLGVLRVASDDAAASVRSALEAGYRSIDTAAVYGNEEGVGRGIRESGVDREDVFLTTKVWNTDHGYEETLAAFDKSVTRLGVDHVDLYLVHWPMAHLGRIQDTWRALSEIKRQGRARSIGVSNFLVKHLELLRAEFDEQPVLNQIELHPWMQQHELRAYHQAHAIVTEAWSPLGQGKLLDEPVLAEIGVRHGKSPAQVVLRWHLDLGHVVIPKSSNPDRIRQNLDVLDFTLTEDEHARLAAMNRDHRIGTHPDTPPTNGLPAGH
ncbi:aldo/keto reductase [Modestobacter sp. VKM Ac-2986]|uniref:aldo/keto reductase n=1 Tax=Modestobacter sp. VKM Ac-2986 TaxID=3004140 RepID=UPI0022AB04EC|nr:aldo/keto reductase [Modestobacter sp. VKM Ac-2986]MCZ2827723.1 aldo/keto reductase [Modestobacter sp. VKM Ac-2986]